MLLKEIEMDFPYIRAEAQGELSAEEIKLDYEINWKRKRRQFQLMTRCMTSMIERIIPRITTKDIRKIVVECVDIPCGKEVKNLLGVCCVQVPFESDLFWGMDGFEKKKYTVKKIGEALKIIAQYDLFDVTEIEKACKRVEEQNYVNEWYWGKPVKNRQISAQVRVLHEVEKVTLYMDFVDLQTGKITGKPLISDIPDEWVYAKYLGKLEWISEGTARLHGKNGKYFDVTCG